MEKKMFAFMENYGGAFFVGSMETKKIIYTNKKAKKLFDVTEENCDFSAIFTTTNERIETIVAMMLDSGKSTSIYNYIVTKANGDKIVVDLQLGYFNEERTEVFLELLPQNDTRMQMALHQVDNSARAEAILNFDDKLSIVHCNEEFHDVFESNEQLRHSHFKNDLINGFLPEVRDELMADIFSNLKISNYHSTKMKVYTATGEERWYLFELERRTLDNSGIDKIMACMTNIEEQVELEENFEYINQFFNAVQYFTRDIVYRIDIKTMTLTHLLDEDTLSDAIRPFGKVIPDYINNLIKSNIIHPDDHEKYKQFAKEYFRGERSECMLRFSILNNDYEWYIIKGYDIYDDNGKLSKIIGTLVNIDEQHKIKEECSLLNQYLSIMQSTTTDILYRVDVETMTLHHFTEVSSDLGVEKTIPNYVKTFMDGKVIHPDDKELYLKNLEEFNNGENPSEPIRFSLGNGEYKWYRVTGKKIYDSQGNLREIFGALIDVDTEHKYQEKATTLSNHFDALQSISEESFYIIDVKNKVLTQMGKVVEELQIYDNVTNFPESVYDMVHKDDLESFKDYTSNSFKGIVNKFKLRLKLPSGEYKWYELYSQVIRNEKDDVVEIVGKMRSVD